jgi:KEOPS complex subunit Cgi121
MAEPEIACEVYWAVFTIDDKIGFLNEIREIANEFETHIILFDADRLAGRDHVEAALRHAWRSWTRGDPIANSIEMEALLYAAGTRQCQVASSFGIHPGENRSYVAVCPPAPGVQGRLAGLVTFFDDDLEEEIDPVKRARLADLFSITPEEVAVVGEGRFRDLVLERVALLDVYR